jgi:hypothetical protein
MRWFLIGLLTVAGCEGGSMNSPSDDGTGGMLGGNAGTPGDNGTGVTGSQDDAGAPAEPCTTRITYGDTWIHGGNHPTQDDVAQGAVTWDGSCTDDGANSYAVLSNGWKPYFTGHSACVLAIDQSASCGPPASCETRVTYGANWLHPANHPAQNDDVGGRLFSDGSCVASGAQSVAGLSNGWAPHYSGSGCPLSFRYSQCGGLYANPTIPTGCADPGVVRDGNKYVLACTGGGYPMFTSTDLVHWTPAGHIFPSGTKPSWATGNFWAPEIHKVGSHWVAYFSALNGARMAIGAASAPTSTGPFTDLGHPLVSDANMGLIDASEITTSGGAAYLLYKEDGNAQGKPTPIHSRPLSADGLSVTGAGSVIITNDQAWEGNLVEGPFMVEHGGEFFLFYSGNAYYDGRYAVGVARASSPTGPFTKAGAPIVTTGGEWVGPGHCSVVDGPDGGSYMIYHAWQSGHVNGPGDQRLALTDAIVWGATWPSLPGAPSSSSRPMP